MLTLSLKVRDGTRRTGQLLWSVNTNSVRQPGVAMAQGPISRNLMC